MPLRSWLTVLVGRMPRHSDDVWTWVEANVAAIKSAWNALDPRSPIA